MDVLRFDRNGCYASGHDPMLPGMNLHPEADVDTAHLQEAASEGRTSKAGWGAVTALLFESNCICRSRISSSLGPVYG